MVQINFMIDLDWLMHEMPMEIQTIPIMLVHGLRQDAFILEVRAI
jgi:hypothetical protein